MAKAASPSTASATRWPPATSTRRSTTRSEWGCDGKDAGPVRNTKPLRLVARDNRSDAITFFQTLSAGGFLATAISFGPARMGFGLFVPEFRDAFAMSTTAVGIVSSLGFSGFFIGLLIAQFLLLRRGPEAPVLAGLAAGTAGLTIVASAPNVVVLAGGVFLAASSAGFAWTPFNDAVHRKVPGNDRPVALSRISTGTAIGVVGAGLAALAMVLLGLSWRVCWAIFAVVCALALVANRFALHPVEKDPNDLPQGAWRTVVRAEALPLYVIALIFGTTSAIYISFAADRMTDAGGVPGFPVGATPALVFIFYGLFGLAGLLTGGVRRLVGLPWLLRGLMLSAAMSMLLVALAPGNWWGLVLSAGLQGMHVMMTSAVLAFWSERLFPALPSFSFTAALLAMAAGSVAGPALAGLASDAFGPVAMFLGAAILPAAAGLMLKDRQARDEAVAGEVETA